MTKTPLALISILAAGCLDDASLSSTSQGVIIGDNNLQDVESYVPKAGSPFPKDYVDYYEPAVGRLLGATGGACSGTLIGRDLFLTASHCPHDGTVQFHYQLENGVLAASDDYAVSALVECGMKSLCGSAYNLKSGNERDFAILRLAPKTAYPGDKYGWRQIDTPDPSILVRGHSPIAVIQHPNADPKKVDTGWVYIWDGLNMDQNADSMPGSSGSGVLDVNGSIIALDDSQSYVDNYGPSMRDIVHYSTVLKGPLSGNTYQLVKARDGGCLDVPAFSKAVGTTIAENVCKTSGYLANQQFRFVRFADGSSEIVEHDSNLCLTTQAAVGSAVYLASCVGATSQMFDVMQLAGDGTTSLFSIRSHNDGSRCLYADGIGGWLNSGTCGATAWWSFRQTKRTYQLVSEYNWQCLDMTGGSKADGVYPQIYPCKTDPTDVFNQEWKLAPQLDGSVTIAAAHSGKCLDLVTPSTNQAIRIMQMTCKVSSTQRWRPVIEPNNAVRFQNMYSGQCITLGPAGFVQLTCGGDPSQSFLLDPGVN